MISTKPINLNQSAELCAVIAKHLHNGDVVALSGDLGAGKTTLVSNIAKNMQLDKSATVSSPTYVIHHIYPARLPIHHIDLYRLEHAGAAASMGFEEFLGEEGVAFIEWFEKFPTLWTGSTLYIQIQIANADQRIYTFKTTGPQLKHWTGMFDEIQKKWND